jgi:hypothetical protein
MEDESWFLLENPLHSYQMVCNLQVIHLHLEIWPLSSLIAKEPLLEEAQKKMVKHLTFGVRKQK